MKGIVALIDSHQLTRDSLARALRLHSPGLRIITADRCNNLANLAADAQLKLALLNIIGTAQEQLKYDIREIHLSHPWLPVVVLSDNESFEGIITAIDQGVRGYLPMSLELHIVAKVLQLVAAGGIFVPAEPFLARFGPATPQPECHRPITTPNGEKRYQLAGFNSRQIAVLNLLRYGLSNKTIARQLNLPEATVKLQVRQIMKRLGVTNRTQAALLLA